MGLNRKCLNKTVSFDSFVILCIYLLIHMCSYEEQEVEIAEEVDEFLPIDVTRPKYL